jgi:ATP-dependent HslUV protease ATP-binding subunit HslU
MPELQGRFPIRVELAGLTRDDFVRILREPEHSLLKQQQALLGTEGLTIEIDDDAIEAMADIAARANSTMENIGARRLMTIVERLFEKISFDAPDMPSRGETTVRITAAMVRDELETIVADEDLSRFVL